MNLLNSLAKSKSIIIRLEEIEKVYGSGNTEVRALDKVNLDIHQGEYCSIMGASGSGKSTAMTSFTPNGTRPMRRSKSKPI